MYINGEQDVLQNFSTDRMRAQGNQGGVGEMMRDKTKGKFHFFRFPKDDFSVLLLLQATISQLILLHSNEVRINFM